MKVTICGSLRFEEEINEVHERLGLAGHTPYCMVVLPSQKGGNKDWYTPHEKMILDLIHLAKIEESDAIAVVNVGGYIGESTAREIAWARIRGKIVYYLEATYERPIKSLYDYPIA
jgi:hypothetical protein